ncbi:hypothetical protein FB468_0989 [Leucobacter komagatae]|uniref:Uncharacterized protein n=1 Tax=Leucobacter komagatae TaxID=55969 RepID=A0A542Y4J8_9MICO|nr:hypothetical protein [Leucobacter komagatae]TQL42978.1 hypothetical protein FB468_0989 [Leucobacter komagatae]
MSTFAKSVDEIRRAIMREHRAGIDVGELLVAAVTAADRQLAHDFRSLTDNRPGSWEAALVAQVIEPEWVE